MRNPYVSPRWRPDHQARCLRRFVTGRPAPQGSKNYLPNGRGRESSEYLPSWRADVRAAFEGRPVPFDNTGPLFAELDFVLTRPKSEPANKHTRPHLGKPDVDKLVRAVLDALRSAGVFRDDSQVIHLVGTKRYAEVGELVGCAVTLGPCRLS